MRKKSEPCQGYGKIVKYIDHILEIVYGIQDTDEIVTVSRIPIKLQTLSRILIEEKTVSRIQIK